MNPRSLAAAGLLLASGCSGSDPQPAAPAWTLDAGHDTAAGADAPSLDVTPDPGAPADAPLVDSHDAQPPLSCDPPPGGIFDHGAFEEGMDGLAPVGWEVRNPQSPAGACAASGAPAQHVFLSDPPAGCSGHALTIDALGTWDCYAIQRVSPYHSIQGGAFYRIQAAVRSADNAPDGSTCPECAAAWFVLGVQWLDANDAFFGDVKNTKPADPALHDHDWQLVSFDVQAPPNAARILVWLTAHYPGRVDYDNVAVLPL